MPSITGLTSRTSYSAVGRERPDVVLAEPHLDRGPGVVAELVVHALGLGEALLGVLHVLRDVRARRRQQGEEPHAPSEVRVAAQEHLVGAEPSDDVLRELEPVDAQDQPFVATPLRELAPRAARTSGVAAAVAHRLAVDRDRMHADRDVAAGRPDPRARPRSTRIAAEPSRGEQEVLGPGGRVEPEDVGAEHPVEELRVDPSGSIRKYIGPAIDVCEKCAIRASGTELAEEPRDEREVVVLDQVRRFDPAARSPSSASTCANRRFTST